MAWQPLQFAPILVPKPWGGRRLAELGRDLPDGVDIGESWDIVDLPHGVTAVADPVSRVIAGPHAGHSLHDLLEQEPDALLGRAATVDGRFPLLIKTLDARQNLSVQVHPSPQYADAHPGVNLKTESWVVLEAAADATLMIGLRGGVSMADVRAAIGTPAIVDLLRRVPAVPGDLHHLPSGVIHALGAGVVVAEVQTPSDTTFRVYDWTREYGRAPRELHLDAAVASMESAMQANLAAAMPSPRGDVTESTDHYDVHRRHVRAGDRLDLPGGDVARILFVAQGSAKVDDVDGALSAGAVALLPAAWDGAMVADTDATVVVFAPR